MVALPHKLFFKAEYASSCERSLIYVFKNRSIFTFFFFSFWFFFSRFLNNTNDSSLGFNLL